MIIGGILVLFIPITRLVSNEIFSTSNKIHREVGRSKDLYNRVFTHLYVAYHYIAGYAGQANTCFAELIHYFLYCKEERWN